MESFFHAGELAVQAQSGVQDRAEPLGQLLIPTIQPAAKAFLQTQSMAAISFQDELGQVWVSLLTGEPGFMQGVAETTVKITAGVDAWVDSNLRSRPAVGLLVIDLATRRRLRLNGTVTVQSGSLEVQTQQVYFNCPQYIQARQILPIRRVVQPQNLVAEALSLPQQQWIGQADTFLIGSAHPNGLDCSHRGGNPGFIQVVNPRQIIFPDYSGNNMFNTLGNLSVNPQAGLLLIDFTTGSLLQLTGRADIIWDKAALSRFAGAERLIRFEIDCLREIQNAHPFAWQFKNYSPFNPSINPN